jgi:hypothetical protein
VIPGRLFAQGHVFNWPLSRKEVLACCSNSSLGEGLNSKGPRPIGPIYALGPHTLENERKMIIEKI